MGGLGHLDAGVGFANPGRAVDLFQKLRGSDLSGITVGGFG